MAKSLCLALLLAISGCSALPRNDQAAPSPCALDEASYACQVERYQNVNVD